MGWVKVDLIRWHLLVILITWLKWDWARRRLFCFSWTCLLTSRNVIFVWTVSSKLDFWYVIRDDKFFISKSISCQLSLNFWMIFHWFSHNPPPSIQQWSPKSDPSADKFLKKRNGQRRLSLGTYFVRENRCCVEQWSSGIRT